jgi:hypothetical protein
MLGTVSLSLLLLAQLSASPPQTGTADANNAAPHAATAAARGAAPEAETLKERLSDKASDEQRVDNCRVAAERRGAAPRPDCAAPPAPAASSASRDVR